LDHGKIWQNYEGGKWIKTGQTKDTGIKTEIKIHLSPTMVGNAFRFILDAAHMSSDYSQGRFDIWVAPYLNLDGKLKEDQMHNDH
jgi:hypothetical protein